MTTDVAQQSGRSRRRRVRVVLRVIVIGIAILALYAGLRFWILADPDRQVTISPETTIFTEPLRENGDVDFFAALDAKLSEGVTADNNAVVLFVEAYGPAEIPPERQAAFFDRLGIPELPGDGDYLIGEHAFASRLAEQRGEDVVDVIETFSDDRAAASSRPWTRDDFPDVAAMLEQNRASLDLIVEASLRSRYYSPLISDDGLIVSPSQRSRYSSTLIVDEEHPMLLAVRQPIENSHRDAARQLAARALWKLGEGDAEGAWQDLLACHRLARLTAQSWNMISAMMAIAIDTIAAASDEGYLSSDFVSAEQARQCLHDLENLPPLPSTADIFDTGERVTLVDSVTHFIRGGTETISVFSGDGETTHVESRRRRTMLNAMIDWDVVLRFANEWCDQSVEAMRIHDYKTRSSELQRLSNEFRTADGRPALPLLMMRSIAGDREATSREFAEFLMALLAPAVEQARLAETRAMARDRLVRIAFALTIHHRERGQYPATLNDLAPDPLDEVPLDPFTDQPFAYFPTDAGGFWIYSLGDNIIIQVHPE